MQHLAENPANIDKFDQLQWSCLHTIAYGVHPELITHNATKKKKKKKKITQHQSNHNK